jgi:hypothetical protein
MAYYSYKRVLELIPKEWQEVFKLAWLEENGSVFDGTADYDGDLWCMAASYIEHLKKQGDDVHSDNLNIAGKLVDAETRVKALECTVKWMDESAKKAIDDQDYKLERLNSAIDRFIEEVKK